MEELRPGQLVRSLAGRDKGEHYLVLRTLDERYALVVNGYNRTLEQPKKKNLAHIQRYERRAVVMEELMGVQKLTDNQVARFIKELAPPDDVFVQEV